MLNAEDMKLFTFNEIGAALNEKRTTDADASKVLLDRAKRKATAKGVTTPEPVAA